ncbi:MAG TPA: sigma-70 family RNA polymerase sigma factor [Acidimicrobiales bacterium]|nr:sigma-70 family RNA polymerase sigma factor [Acidimicrobiales bacterium]
MDMGQEAPVSLVHGGGGQNDTRAVLEELFRDSWGDLVRLATFLTGSVPVAEDLVQDTFLRYGSRRTAADEPAKYLRTSVVNACRSYHRRRLLERRHRPGLPRPDADNPGELWDVLDRLSPRQRTALVLRYYLDLPENEIAAVLRCRPATVRSLVQRGLAKLREELSP